MKTQSMLIAVALVACATGISACSKSDTPQPVVAPFVPPPPPPPVVFSEFVKTQFANTADNTDPQSVDDTDFTFDGQDEPSAYDDLLANP
jgi:hypothetical protein